MTYSIVEKTLEPQPVLVLRKRVKLSEIGATIRNALRVIHQYGQRHGLVLAGPFTRYIEVGAGEMVIEPGIRIVGSVGSSAAPDRPVPCVPAEDEAHVVRDVLPGGLAAATVHEGPYETLVEAHAAIEQWMECGGRQPRGLPWESYLTGPSDCPNPWEWKTEVCWPFS